MGLKHMSMQKLEHECLQQLRLCSPPKFPLIDRLMNKQIVIYPDRILSDK